MCPALWHKLRVKAVHVDELTDASPINSVPVAISLISWAASLDARVRAGMLRPSFLLSSRVPAQML